MVLQFFLRAVSTVKLYSKHFVLTVYVSLDCKKSEESTGDFDATSNFNEKHVWAYFVLPEISLYIHCQMTFCKEAHHVFNQFLTTFYFAYKKVLIQCWQLCKQSTTKYPW